MTIKDVVGKPKESHAYNIDPEQLKAFLVNEGLMLVSLKEVRHMEEAKLARFRA